MIAVGVSSKLFGQTWPADTISTKINTGNPSYPFPQFNEYAVGKTLGKYNSEGVTHADMEKTMREGYKIMMHRCLYVPGKTLNGKKYIVYNHGSVPYNNNTFVSEGDGYALLAAAYFADKDAFDGLWLWIHDNRLSKVKRYDNCADLRPAYRYGANLPGWKNTQATADNDGDNDSATDGDYDIAMGLLLAYKQWGELMGIKDGCGNDINYKTEALNMIKALVDTVKLNNVNGGYSGHLSGDIGIDGYCKNGNTWGEVSNWRYGASNTTWPWAKSKPEAFGVGGYVYTDYIGPAYFNQFAKFLNVEGGTPWQINQFLRGEASSDWMMGQMYAKGYIPSSGYCTINDDGSTVTFAQHPSGPGGEDFRASWRTILNYMWHGDASTTWNPVTHQISPTPNTYEKDIALRHANFLKFPRTLPSTDAAARCSKLGASPDLSCPNYKGVVQIKQAHLVTGAEGSDNYRTNYNVGTGAPAAVASEDLDLIAEIYRQNEILWDDVNTSLSKNDTLGRYIKSTPKYFHDWFRLLGMLTTTGNLHPPTSINAAANVKVYMAVDKTYAYGGDLITYTVSYRNYGSVAANTVKITTLLDSDYQFVSATNGGTLSGSTITWNVGTVPGFQTSTGIPPTTGEMKFTVRVVKVPTHARVCLTSTITATNSISWTSNEYPNNATYTMERNCVDLLQNRSLSIKKTVDRPVMNPGDIANFTLNFENKSAADLWLNGGRDRVILSYGNYFLPSNTFYQFYRFWHSAQEAYINMNNYRVSYFLNDPAAIGLYNATTNPNGWDFSVDNQSDLDKYLYNPTSGPITFGYQAIPWGSDANGSWNQRIIVRFAKVLTSPTTHIYDKLDNPYLIHKGVIGPGFIRTKMESKPASNLTTRLVDDWSYSNTIDIGKVDGQDKRLTPITNGWANYNNLNVPITNYGKDVCDPDVPNYNRLLVEEFDGYTWRRIAGNGPLPGRETYNVVVYDTIPKQLSWKGFTDSLALGIKATYTASSNPNYTGIVKWEIPIMLVGEVGDLKYQTIAKDPPCPSPDINFINVGWIKSQTDSPDSSQVNLKITCNPVPPTSPVQTSLFKTSSVPSVKVGDALTYTVKFKNTDGSAASWVNSATDWQALGNGVIPKLNGTSISLDQNGSGNPSPGTYGYAFGPTKVHGKNGYIETTIDPVNSSKVSLIMRYTAGTPGQTDFKGVRIEITPNPMGANTMDLVIYNNATPLISYSNISYGGSSDPIKIKAEIVNDKLYIWVNNYDGAPLKVATGITQLSAGYTGIYSNSQQSITAYYAHFDSAFDIVITDPVPSDLNNISNITNGGVLTGSTITWNKTTNPIFAGPLLAGDSIVSTFDTKVVSCTNFITNKAYGSAYGITGLVAQNIVSCATTTPLFFIDFSAHENGKNTVVLDWTVAYSEKGTFIILGSVDNSNFVELSKTDALANKTTYHLQVVNDISYSYFKVVFVSGNKHISSKTIKINSESTGISLYPNPFDNEITLQIQDENTYAVKIIAVTGAVLEHISNISKGTHRLGAVLPAGIYLIEVSSEEGFEHFKIVKE